MEHLPEHLRKTRIDAPPNDRPLPESPLRVLAQKRGQQSPESDSGPATVGYVDEQIRRLDSAVYKSFQDMEQRIRAIEQAQVSSCPPHDPGAPDIRGWRFCRKCSAVMYREYGEYDLRVDVPE